MVDSLAKAPVAGAVVDVFFDFGRAVACADAEFGGKTFPYRVKVSGRESRTPEVTGVFAVGVDVVVIAELAVYAALESLESGVFPNPVAGFDYIGSESLEFFTL